MAELVSLFLPRQMIFRGVQMQTQRIHTSGGWSCSPLDTGEYRNLLYELPVPLYPVPSSIRKNLTQSRCPLTSTGTYPHLEVCRKTCRSKLRHYHPFPQRSANWSGLVSVFLTCLAFQRNRQQMDGEFIVIAGVSFRCSPEAALKLLLDSCM